jgi:hypothetical protein
VRRADKDHRKQSSDSADEERRGQKDQVHPPALQVAGAPQQDDPEAQEDPAKKRSSPSDVGLTSEPPMIASGPTARWASEMVMAMTPSATRNACNIFCIQPPRAENGSTTQCSWWPSTAPGHRLELATTRPKLGDQAKFSYLRVRGGVWTPNRVSPTRSRRPWNRPKTLDMQAVLGFECKQSGSDPSQRPLTSAPSMLGF